MVIRRLNKNSEPQASIEADKYTIQCVCPFRLKLSLCYMSSRPASLVYLPTSSGASFPSWSLLTIILTATSYNPPSSFLPSATVPILVSSRLPTFPTWLPNSPPLTHHNNTSRPTAAPTLSSSSILLSSVPRRPTKTRARRRISIG